jgi:molybdate transport system substrate-binding protein
VKQHKANLDLAPLPGRSEPTADRRRMGRIPNLAALLVLVVAAVPCRAEPVRVLAAVTLKPALDAIAKKYRGGDVELVYGPSPSLAKQIENGLPADLFFSADTLWMDELAQRHLIRPETRTDLVGNRLVLVARKGSREPVRIAPGFPLSWLVGAGPLAMCDPDSHPAGRDGKASLVKLGVWQSVENKVARVDNPLVAVKMVARGDAPMAVVFATDAATDAGVEIIGTFPDETHPKIVYPVAVLAQSRNPDAGGFFGYLKSSTASAVFRKFGYATLSPETDR